MTYGPFTAPPSGYQLNSVDAAQNDRIREIQRALEGEPPPGISRIPPDAEGNPGEVLSLSAAGIIFKRTPYHDLSHPRWAAVANDPGFNNIPAINGAITAINAIGGGKLVVPEGTWWVRPVSGDVVNIGLRSNVEIEGVGRASRIKVQDGTGNYRRLFSSGPTISTLIEGVAFRNIAIDQNPSGNPGSNVDINTAGHNAFQILNFHDVTLDRVWFDPYCGVWALAAMGAQNLSSRVTVRNSFFRFERANSTVYAAGRYDSSTVYTSNAIAHITDNTFVYDGPDAAFPDGAIEVHGPMQVVTGNVIENFGVPIWVLPQTSAATNKGTLSTVVTGNIGRRCAFGVGIYPVNANHAASEIVVADNTFHIDSASKPYRTSVTGMMIGLAGFGNQLLNAHVHHNIIVYEDDQRTTTPTGATIQWGLGGICLSGTPLMRNIRIDHNLVVGCPGNGLRLNGGAGVRYEDVQAMFNEFRDCGRNLNVDPTWRVGISVVGSGEYVRSVIDHNRIVDTGAPSRYLQYAWLVSTMTGTNRDLTFGENNRHQSVTGTLPTIMDTTNVILRQRSVSVGFGSIPAHSCASQTVTIKGARAGDLAWANPSVNPGSLFTWSAFVSADDTIMIRVCNPTTGALTAGTINWRVGYRPAST